MIPNNWRYTELAFILCLSSAPSINTFCIRSHTVPLQLIISNVDYMNCLMCACECVCDSDTIPILRVQIKLNIPNNSDEFILLYLKRFLLDTWAHNKRQRKLLYIIRYRFRAYILRSYGWLYSFELWESIKQMVRRRNETFACAASVVCFQEYSDWMCCARFFEEF